MNRNTGKLEFRQPYGLSSQELKDNAKLSEAHADCEQETEPLRYLAELAQLLFDSAFVSITMCNPPHRWIYSSASVPQIAAFERFERVCEASVPPGQTITILDFVTNPGLEQSMQSQESEGIRFFVRTSVQDRPNRSTVTVRIADFLPKKEFSERDHQILNSLATWISRIVKNQCEPSDINFNRLASTDRYALIFRAALDGVWDWDITSGAVYYSPRWQYILGFTECELTDGLDHWLGRVHPDDLAAVQDGIEQNLQGNTPRFRSEHRVRHGDGSWRWIAVRGMAQRNSANEPTRMAGSVADITEEKTSDSLTGLPNRLMFADRAAQLIERCEKYGLWHFAVLAIDINGLCQFNERFGHECGDLILRTVAGRLRETVGQTRVGVDSMVFRAESDEFLILLDGVNNASQAYGVGERIHSVLRQPVEYGHDRLEVKASIGITIARPNLCAPEQLLADSKTALSRAKATPNASTIILTSSAERRASSLLELEESLLEALPLNQLTTFFQPQINLDTGGLTGCEALVRWNHPKLGLIEPAEFIQLSEEMGLISIIDSWMLNAACQQLAQWRDKYDLPNFTMSVNISSHTLSKRGLRMEVEDVLLKHSIPSKALCLELTESVLLQENSSGVEIMNELRDIGVGLHMDDFGTGYSSFKYLYELPFDALKIDSSFMCHFPSDKKARNVIEGILALARTMDLYVVAEGIEDPLQARTLKLMGCKVGQGYLFDRPLSGSRFREKYFDGVPRKHEEGVRSVSKGQSGKKG